MIRTREQIRDEIKHHSENSKALVEEVRLDIENTPIEKQMEEIQQMLNDGKIVHKKWVKNAKKQIKNGTFRIGSIDSFDGVEGYLKKEGVIE